MKTPPWLMGLALLFWGWENGQWMWGLLLAAGLEASRWTRTRWEFSDADLNRICDLCATLFLGISLVLYSTSDRLLFIFKLAQWLPVCFYPIMLAQTYGDREKLPLSVFWWLLRRAPDSATARKAYNISYCYFAICLLAASSSNSAAYNSMTRVNRYYYPCVTLLIFLALTYTRPRRVSTVVWVFLLGTASVAGFFSHKQLQRMQGAMEGAIGALLANLLHSPQDVRECRTQIGYEGRLALSGKIVLRVHPEPGGITPGLLREAVWDTYHKESWTATNNDFNNPPPRGPDDEIRLLPSNAISSRVTISRYYDGGKGLLVEPQGTFQLTGIDLSTIVKTNRLGMVEMEEGPGLLIMTAEFGPGRSTDMPPEPRDLLVPPEEKAVLARIVRDMKMDAMTERQRIRAVERFFSSNFTYTLDLPRPPKKPGPTPLGYFLTESRRGHCQYFATATVLLLREAGVPARFATGYALPDSARQGGTYLIRERHAHAWAMAWHGDTQLWEQIDTTPQTWDKDEAAQPPWWEPGTDALSNLYFEFSKWRWSRTSYARYAGWLFPPVILYLLFRIFQSQRQRRRQNGGRLDPASPTWPGGDSELYLINTQLAASPYCRQPNESLLAWQNRLQEALPGSSRLHRIFQLHRCLRFDPRGLPGAERDTLRNEARQWMSEFAQWQEVERQNAAAAAVKR